MRRHQAVLETYADEVVARRRSAGVPQPDFLQALLEARPGGRPLSDRQLRYQVLGLFGAGNETTAATMGWAMVYGAAHPEKWSAMRSDASAIKPYVEETLRLRPQAWGFSRSSRLSSEYVSFAHTRYRVLPHHGVIINVWGMNHDEKLWPRPETFEPARHFNLTQAQERASFPFGLGPRGCIGQHLATAEMLTVLPALARHGDVHVDGPTVPDPVLTLRVTGGLYGRFTAPQTTKQPVGLPS
jgi:cytochrome P450